MIELGGGLHFHAYPARLRTNKDQRLFSQSRSLAEHTHTKSTLSFLKDELRIKKAQLDLRKTGADTQSNRCWSEERTKRQEDEGTQRRTEKRTQAREEQVTKTHKGQLQAQVEERGRSTGRGQTKKRKHKKEKAQAQKEESYGGGKQTTTNGWFCCRYPESRQED